MMWRVARLNPDGAVAHEAGGGFEEVMANAPAAGSSFLDRLKLHLGSDEYLAEELQSGNAEALTVLFKRHSP